MIRTKVTTSFVYDGIRMENVNMNQVAALMNRDAERWAGLVVKTHLKVVFQVLKLIIRICPVVTGRLRGSWTPFFDKYGLQHLYAKEITAERGKPNTFDPKAEAEGKTKGFYVDEILNTTVGSNVQYAAGVEARKGFVALALVRGQKWYTDAFNKVWAACKKSGRIIEADLNEDLPI